MEPLAVDGSSSNSVFEPRFVQKTTSFDPPGCVAVNVTLTGFWKTMPSGSKTNTGE